MAEINVKFSKENIEWAEEIIKEKSPVNKDSEIEKPSKEFDLVIARLVLQESKKQK